MSTETPAREYVCGYCCCDQHGFCRDRACTCCYGEPEYVPSDPHPRVEGAAVVNADPDKPCPHETFTADVTVNRIAEPGQQPTAYMADITVACADCDEKFRWVGVRAGMNYSGPPMCSVDETELRAPLRPASADPDFGMGIPGFAVTARVLDGDDA